MGAYSQVRVKDSTKQRTMLPSPETTVQQKQYNILKSKAYLYMTEFFSGMAIMAVELGVRIDTSSRRIGSA